MAHHRHGRSPVRKSTACHQTLCRHSAARPSVSHEQRTPSRTDFIPSWLQHVPTSYHDSPGRAPREASPADAPETSWHPNGISNIRIQSTYAAGRYPSSDLFIQDSPSPAPSAVPTGRHHYHHHETDLHSDYSRASVDRKGEYRSRTTISTPPPASVVKDNVFEKRPRRKTRQDRYDTVKSKDAVPIQKQAKRPSARVSKTGRLRSSREVMTNFTSSAIANPNERITLKSTFTPGLFVNGRSSAPLADLVFNEIPLPDEDGEPIEINRSSNSRPKKRKEERARREDIEYLTNALKRLKEDYPAPEYLGSRSISIISGGDSQSIQRSSTADVIVEETTAKEASPMPCHGGLGGGSATEKTGDSNRLRSLHDDYELRKHSVCSRTAVNETSFSNLNIPKIPIPSDGNSRPKDQKKSPEEQPELEPIGSRDEPESCSSQAVQRPDYQDKGVMVSPWMHQRTEIRKPSDSDCESPPLCPDELSLPCVHAVPQIPVSETSQRIASPDYKVPGKDIPSIESDIYGYPAYLPGFSANLDCGVEVKDATYSRSDPSPAWFFGRPSSQYPFMAVDSYTNQISALVDNPGSSTSSNIQSRNTSHPGVPPQPTGPRQISTITQETCQDLAHTCMNALQDDEVVPGESLTEYIERMEHDILGSDETSSLFIDDGLLPAQSVHHNQVPEVPHTVDVRYPNGSFCRMGSERLLSPKGLTQRPVHETLGWPSQQYKALPRPESLNSLDDGTESELASFWRPNYMMWC